ncbi:MAG TPA: helix-turn-helix domain-containing protein, partial [Ktedonobacteraceae bacterium]|nr:helix-turn-helix domain-containing protein [Ktedonobacteraceae bacterium]
METSSPISFGELLKMYRKQRGLTQQQLARKLDTHHNTIGAWERGDYLPATRGMILELGQCLHLDEDETHHLLEASLLTVTSRWSVPYQRNPFFTGRQEVLQQLHKFLSDGQNVSSGHMCILRGLGGMGKTQTALEYAYQHAQDYAAVFWINAQTKEDLLGSVVAIAKVLQLPAHYMQKREEAITLVLDWLHAHRDWLLVCDNVVESVLIQRFIPVAHHGSLLATTRLTTLGTLAPCLELLPMPLEESVQLLLRRAETQLRPQPLMQISTEETIATRTIASTMDGLPLALDQAAAYIEESQCCFVGFLSLLQHNTLQLLREHPASANYPYSVEKTFTLTFKSLCKQNQAAADILTLCCFLAPDEIPEALLLKGASYLSDELQAVFSDPSRLHEAFKDLLAHALLRRNMQAKTLRVHRLVQTVLKEQLPSAVQKTWVERLICVLDQHFLVEQGQLKAEHQNWNEQLLPHAQRIFQIADHLKITSPALISLLHKTATYLFQRARYEQAEQLYLHMLAIQEQAEEANHPDLILPLIWLAQSYLAQRKYQ